MFVAVDGRVRSNSAEFESLRLWKPSMPWTSCVSSGVQTWLHHSRAEHAVRQVNVSGAGVLQFHQLAKRTSSWSGICHQDARDRTQKSRGPENHQLARDRRRHEIKYFHAPSDRSLVLFFAHQSMFFEVYRENCEAASAGCSTQNLSHEGPQTLRVTPHKHNVQLEITRECAANFENERRPTNMNVFSVPRAPACVWCC